ncbi:MAG: hypothetical protein AAFU67_13105, partial [Bacteroidota bacterium]
MKFSYILLPILLISCGSSTNEASGAGNIFFDLPGYFDQITSATQQFRGEKTLVLNGQEESRELKEADLTSDLALFRSADINRPAWKDKYEIVARGKDTSYVALDTTLRTQLLRVQRSANGEVSRIEIKRRSGNVLSSGQQEMVFEPGIGYSIYSTQIGDL